VFLMCMTADPGCWESFNESSEHRDRCQRPQGVFDVRRSGGQCKRLHFTLFAFSRLFLDWHIFLWTSVPRLNMMTASGKKLIYLCVTASVLTID